MSNINKSVNVTDGDIDTKTRKIYAFGNFRGLDKENKALDVAYNRASEGYNFRIKGNSIKTRPAFKFKKELPFVLDEGDYLIDWYNFGVSVVYITKNHIYMETGSTVINETDTSHLISFPFGSLDFEEKRPFFTEEKSCLFIFCLGTIYVLSILSDIDGEFYKFVLYDIRYKPANPFSTSDYFYEIFEELPTPYEPLLYIGNDVVDDVNLLSPVSRYKLFANGHDIVNGKITFALGTHYDSNKHGKYSHEISFYGDALKPYGILPIFLGVLGENFTSLSPYTVLNASDPIVISDMFYPAADFYFSRVAGTPPVDTGISETVGIEKTDFFKLSVKDSILTAFDYIVNYIKENYTTISDDDALLFELPISYTAIYKDSTNDYVVEQSVKESTVNVYVRLKTYIKTGLFFDEQEILKSEKVTASVGSSDPYPSYPAVDGTHTYAIYFGAPLEKPGFNENTFIEDALAYLQAHVSTYSDGDTFLVRAQYHEIISNIIQAAIQLERKSEWFYSSESASITWGDATTFPAYPSFSNPGGYDVIETTIISTSGQYFDYDKIWSDIEAAIKARFGDLTDDSGYAFAKVKIQTYYYDTYGSLFQKGISIVIPFSFSKEIDNSYEVRQSTSFTCVAVDDTRVIEDEFYSFTYNKNSEMFELKINDYFYDNNNEPCIELKVSFADNPNFDLIANMKFGIVFGTEGRIFLAGNSDYPNIDRYNESNDLLGDNDVSQSYEAAYFPSKNYRLMGGKGAINGYVVGTDDTLYVTKATYPNDSVLFVRSRNVDDDGLVSYSESKTSVKQSPLNDRCIVRFCNDIIILSKNGLFGIELSSNVLTDERLQRHRDGFINKDLVAAIKAGTAEDIFVLENNNYMYIFIGETVYFADIKYTASNENSEVDNVSYEIVKWSLDKEYKTGHFEDDLVLVDTAGKILYEFDEEENRDDDVTRYPSELAINNTDFGEHNAFIAGANIIPVLSSPDDYRLKLDAGYKLIGNDESDYHIDVDGTIIIDNDVAFRAIEDGDTLYFSDGSSFYPFTVGGMETSERANIVYNTEVLGLRSNIYKNIAGLPLYISVTFDYDGAKLFRLSLVEPDTVNALVQGAEETDEDYLARILESFIDNDDFFFEDSGMMDCLLNHSTLISLRWLSNISDFGNNFMEKTMFRVNLYATKQDKENVVKFGYKTMRRLKALEESSDIYISNNQTLDLSSTFDMNTVDFNLFSMNTFNEVGMSFHAKENNFLYIQMMLLGEGQIEINAVEILYKLNRLLKSIG